MQLIECVFFFLNWNIYQWYHFSSQMHLFWLLQPLKKLQCFQIFFFIALQNKSNQFHSLTTIVLQTIACPSDQWLMLRYREFLSPLAFSIIYSRSLKTLQAQWFLFFFFLWVVVTLIHRPFPFPFISLNFAFMNKLCK